MKEFAFQKLDKKWQKIWKEKGYFKVNRETEKPKYYVLDMFPYPSGAGLHVGHPLGYIASDIIARYKRHQGYEVLHPMGYDAFGLPAEQYAIKMGIHPAVSTEQNIERYRKQLEMLGLSYDPDAELKTCDPKYYKWTQWIFLQFFKHYYDKNEDKAKPIAELIKIFETEGNKNVNAATSYEKTFSAEEWKNFSEEEKQEILLQYRLAYRSETMVNWCPELGTVLANDEVKEGFSVRGGHPVYRVPMKQWFLRITAYAERLLQGLNKLDWVDSVKEMQRNWIGKSEGALVNFPLENEGHIEVFTTRPDTIFGATFMVLAPEHPLVEKITTEEHKEEVKEYVTQALNKSERERMMQQGTPTGAFTGAYAVNPVTKKKIPVWVSEYILFGYGTGAIMAVPAHDSRDHAFAKHFGLPIVQVIKPTQGEADVSEEAFESKEGILINSDFLNGLKVPDAIRKIIEYFEEKGIGKREIQYKLRDAVFSRQRYWGEPFPIVYRNGIPYPVDEKDLPVTLPDIDDYKPTGTGKSPLTKAKDWLVLPDGSIRETDTMPAWAGSSWYFLRYIDPKNDEVFCRKEYEEKWMPVDFYLGGAEHAVGHLLYSRFFTKVLYDLGYVSHDEPFQKLVNQGMIQGRSSIAYKRKDKNEFVSYDKIQNFDDFIPIHVDINLVENDTLDVEAFREWMPEYKDASFILSDDNRFRTGVQIEKMSKSFYNVVNPDDLCEKYGADTFRLYEMFLGPIEQHKPWSTQGISGTYNFLKKLWNFLVSDDGKVVLSEEAPTKEELKELHKTIKKVTTDIENLNFNTCVSQFMIYLNFLTKHKLRKRELIEPFLIMLSPFAPHIAEELWERSGHSETVQFEPFPAYNEEFLKEDTKEYPVAINGKVRAKIKLPANISSEDARKIVLELDKIKKYTEGKSLKRFIFVPNRMINIVV